MTMMPLPQIRVNARSTALQLSASFLSRLSPGGNVAADAAHVALTWTPGMGVEYIGVLLGPHTYMSRYSVVLSELEESGGSEAGMVSIMLPTSGTYKPKGSACGHSWMVRLLR